MLLLAGHRVNDDGALQSDLKLFGRARRQVFLPQLLAVDDDAGPRLGVIGLIADDQLYRLALLAELDCRVSRARRQQGYARQRRPNSDSLAELRHPFPPWTKIARLPRADRRVKNRNQCRNTRVWSATRQQSLCDRIKVASGMSAPATTPQQVERTPDSGAPARDFARDGIFVLSITK